MGLEPNGKKREKGGNQDTPMRHSLEREHSPEETALTQTEEKRELAEMEGGSERSRA